MVDRSIVKDKSFSLARFARDRRERGEGTRRLENETLVLLMIHFWSSLRTLWALREKMIFIFMLRPNLFSFSAGS